MNTIVMPIADGPSRARRPWLPEHRRDAPPVVDVGSALGVPTGRARSTVLVGPHRPIR
ncbi:hypothetical protein [Embleya sp. NPDC001921]